MIKSGKDRKIRVEALFSLHSITTKTKTKTERKRKRGEREKA